jgi:hypothetical protein
MPTSVLIGYVPSESSVQLKSNGDNTLAFEPLWSPSLFGSSVSTVSIPVSKMSKVSHSSQQAEREKTAIKLLPILKRRKPYHLEFFPTGFKITAFPTLLTILGLTGYTTFKAGNFLFRFGRDLYEKR